MIELKPCPFCGAPAHPWEAWGHWGVECEFCDAKIRDYGTRERAIEVWNTNKRRSYNPCPRCGKDYRLTLGTTAQGALAISCGCGFKMRLGCELPVDPQEIIDEWNRRVKE